MTIISGNKVVLDNGLGAVTVGIELYNCSSTQLQDAISMVGDISSIKDKATVISTINAAIRHTIDEQYSQSSKAFNPNDPVSIFALGGPVGVDNSVWGRVDNASYSKDSYNREQTTRDELGLPEVRETLKRTYLSTPKSKSFEQSGLGFTQQGVLSGSDLSVFYFVEIPDMEDINNGIPVSVARKELIMMEFDSVLSLSWSTIREKFPVRSLGMINAKAVTNGIRTIAGHIAFNIFAEDVLTRLRGKLSSEMEKRVKAIQAGVIKNKASNSSVIDANAKLNLLEANMDSYSLTPLAGERFKSMLLDQLPPFHLLIMGTNEMGVLSRMLIKNVSIVDENQYQGTQQPNIVNRVSFVAQDIIPMTASLFEETIITSSLSAIEEGYIGGNWQWSGVDMTGTSILNDIELDKLQREMVEEQ